MKNYLIILIIIGLSLILYLFDIRICPFYNLFHIPCPGCGITRATVLLLQGRVIDSFSYNILPIPLLLLLVTYMVLYLTRKLDGVIKYILKHKTFFIILLIIITIVVWIININNSNLY